VTMKRIPTGPVELVQTAPITGALGWCQECGMDNPDHYEDCEERSVPPAGLDAVDRLRMIRESAERARKARGKR